MYLVKIGTFENFPNFLSLLKIHFTEVTYKYGKKSSVCGDRSA